MERVESEVARLAKETRLEKERMWGEVWIDDAAIVWFQDGGTRRAGRSLASP